ncbi:MAG: MFS transporter [Lentisphaerae bacterium]|nr:MFS transporter [Lentisphaerota bacterium]MCP4102624.1 MFS transporter [Lentisphaerota bacterium]
MKKVLLLSSMIFMAYTGIVWGILGVIVKSVASDMNVTASAVAGSYSFFSLASGIVVVLSTGLFLQYISLKKLALLACAIPVISAGLFFTTNSLIGFRFILLFFGIGFGMCCCLSYYLIVLASNNKNRASLMAIISFLFGLGTMVTPIAGSHMLASGINWRYICLIFSAILVALFMIILFSKFAAEKTGDETPSETNKLSLKEEIKTWPFVVYLIALTLMAYMAAEITVITWLVVYGQVKLNLSIVDAGILSSVFWFSVLIGRILTGIVLKKISTEIYIIFVSLFSGICIVVFSLFSMPIILVYGLVAFMGLGLSALYPVLTAFGTTQIPKASPRLFTLIVGIGWIGMSVGPMLTSKIKSLFGLTTVFIVCAALCFVMAILTVIVKVINYTKNRVKSSNTMKCTEFDKCQAG